MNDQTKQRRTNVTWFARFPQNRIRRMNASQLFVLSFVAIILLGTAGLKIIPGMYRGEFTWLDALFTATSAVCVTGLIVVDTATFFTPAGQLWVLVLIQLGGIGMMTFTSLILIAIGQRLSLRQESILMNFALVNQRIEFGALLWRVLAFTAAIEAVGALVLFLRWLPEYPASEALWHAIFQSVSAFCNAGFSTFSDSAIGLQSDPISLFGLAVLIVLGGLGFGTLLDLSGWFRSIVRRGAYRFTLHSQLVLLVTAALLGVGFFGYLILEWDREFSTLRITDRFSNAMFMSVTARTAGFNSIDYAKLSDSSNFLTILLMAVGGSPGSMAGGLKTTTVAVIGLAAWSRLRGRGNANIFGRTVPDEIIRRAMGLFVLTFGLTTLWIFLLGAAGTTKPGATNFLHYMFEVVSAFNTVGLSLDVTPNLTASGKLLVIVMMLVGRVGPLTISAALVMPLQEAHSFRYSREEISIG